MSRRRKRLPREPVRVNIEGLSHEGKGIARVDGKTVFVDGALAGEEVSFVYTRSHKTYDEGMVQEIFRPAANRIQPRCQAFGICGGCSLQHLSAADQIAFKQQDLLEKFQRLGKVQPETVLSPLTSDEWGYRRKARLGVKHVAKKGRVLVGFREKNKPYIADMQRCEILHPAVGEHLMDLSALVGTLSIPDKVPQIEVAIGDEIKGLVFRHLEAFTDDDHEKLAAFGRKFGFQIYLQPKGPDSIHCLWPAEPLPLSYTLPEFGMSIEFEPSDFTQVNSGINRQMVSRAVELLDVQADETVLDLFCGLGNFSLPLATRAKHVVAVEGDEALVERAQQNAQRNQCANTEFHVANLFADFTGAPWLKKVDKLLLDPPRSGALEIAQLLHKIHPQRIVYVSCDPATLARDTAEIVHNQGYQLSAAGVMDMFPHTAHVESIAIFEKQ